jgi:hypothetical protein
VPVWNALARVWTRRPSPAIIELDRRVHTHACAAIISHSIRSLSMRNASLAILAVLGLLLACTPAPAPAPAPEATATPLPEIISPTGYRPLQPGDIVEGAKIEYHYVLPSLDRPVVTLAFGPSLMQLVLVKPELTAGLVAYFQDLENSAVTAYAFDEADPAQLEPEQLSLEMSKPVEVAIIPITEGKHVWSVTESQDGELKAAYKLVRRKDGGLRFVDAYDPMALNSFVIVATRNGTGSGLVFSARLALLRLILSDAGYQRGPDALTNRPPSTGQYDPRILKLDPTRQGLDQNVDWALVSRAGPNPGIIVQ